VGRDDLGCTGCANGSFEESVLDSGKRWSVGLLSNVGESSRIDVDFLFLAVVSNQLKGEGER